MPTEPITRPIPSPGSTMLGNPPPARRPSRWPVWAAAIATAVLVVGAVLAAGGRSADRSAAPPAAAVATSSAATATTEPESTDVVEPPLASVAPVPSADDADDAPTATLPPVPTLPPPAAPPPTPTAPAPAPELALTDHYDLDPGVHDVTVTLANAGDATLHFDIANDGDGFSVDIPGGSIPPGQSIDVFVEVDVAPDGDGPTPFERSIHVVSDGGAATITVVGQVEKPGFVVAEYESVPFVDYRATVRFTNVGELAVEILGVDVPGLRLSPLPDVIAAGETLDIEVAICEAGADLPVFFATPHLPLPLFTFAGYVTLETSASAPHTSVAGMSHGFFPPSCQAVVTLPTGDLTLGG